MAEQIQQLEAGNIKISNDVVGKIAGMAALETPGIAAMSGGLSEGWAKRLSGKNVQKAYQWRLDSWKLPLIYVLSCSTKHLFMRCPEFFSKCARSRRKYDGFAGRGSERKSGRCRVQGRRSVKELEPIN